MNMKAVIMAGGPGERLGPITKIIPKPLLPIGGQSIMEITIRKIKEHGFNEVIIATNYMSDLFESYFGDGSKFGVKIKYSRETERLGTAGPLSLIKNEFKEPFLVINGDILSDLNFSNLLEFHKKNKADFTLVSKELDLPLQYGQVEHVNGIVKDIKEKPNIKAEVLAGIYIITPEALEHIPDGHYLMTDFIRDLARKGLKVCRYPADGYWLDIGRAEDYQKAQEHANEGSL